MEPTYVVIKRGVYMQDVYGPYHCSAGAAFAACALADADIDNYHFYEVHEVTHEGLVLEPLYTFQKEN
jgi:hypothetical protein